MTPEEKVLWDLGIFIGKTIKRQHEDIRELLDAEPGVVDMLGRDWCNEHLLFAEPVPLDDAHPLFFHLASPWRSERLVANLKYFAEKLPGRLSSFLGRLKNDRSKSNVISLLHQLDAYCQISRRGYVCDWEPLIQRGEDEKRPDLCVVIGERKVYIEVFTICTSAADEEDSRLVEDLRVRVNHIRDNPYVVVYNPEFGSLHADQAEPLFSFIEQQIRSGTLPTNTQEERTVDFEHEGHKVGEVSFERTSHGHGHWLGSYSGGHRNDSFRIKKKILDKLEADRFQLPAAPELGGYLIVIDDSWCSIRDAIDAVVGSETATFYSDSRPATSGRARDGVMHHPNGTQLSDVQFFAFKGSHPATENDNGWVPGNVKVIMHSEATLTDTEILALFIQPDSSETPSLE